MWKRKIWERWQRDKNIPLSSIAFRLPGISGATRWDTNCLRAQRDKRVCKGWSRKGARQKKGKRVYGVDVIQWKYTQLPLPDPVLSAFAPPNNKHKYTKTFSELYENHVYYRYGCKLQFYCDFLHDIMLRSMCQHQQPDEVNVTKLSWCGAEKHLEGFKAIIFMSSSSHLLPLFQAPGASDILSKGPRRKQNFSFHQHKLRTLSRGCQLD